METRGGKRMRFKIRQYGVVSKYRGCAYACLSGREIRMLSDAEINAFTRHVNIVIDRRQGKPAPQPPKITRRSVV